MIEFFVWLFMVCVVPFIFAMLELRFKEAKRPCDAHRGNGSWPGRPSLVIQFTTEQRGHELVRVCARD